MFPLLKLLLSCIVVSEEIAEMVVFIQKPSGTWWKQEPNLSASSLFIGYLWIWVGHWWNWSAQTEILWQGLACVWHCPMCLLFFWMLLFVLTALSAEKSGHARIQYKNTHNTNRNFFYKLWSSGKCIGRREVDYFLGSFNFNSVLGQKEEMQGNDSFSCTL